MIVVRTVLAEIKRTFDLHGRTARAPYLIFLGVSVILFAGTMTSFAYALPTETLLFALASITALFYLPVTTAGMRRLHDTGESGSLMFTPLKPMASFVLLSGLTWVWVSMTKTGTIVGLLAAYLFAKIFAALMFIAGLIVLAINMMHVSHTMGLLLLPSQPGPNAYGSNPNEVLQ